MVPDKKFVVIIVNSIEPYCHELNNILALPEAFTYRFRYQKNKLGEWMPEVDDPKELRGCEGLVVLREFQKTAKFIPIRKIALYNVMVIGDIVYLEYRLGLRIPFSSDLKKRDEQIARFNQRILTDIKTDIYPNTPGEDLKNLVFFGTDYTYDFLDEDYRGAPEDEDANRWGNLIDLIGTFEGHGIEVLRDVDFLKITDISDDDGNPARIIERREQAEFLLKNRRNYSMRFLQRAHTGRKGTSAVLTPRTIQLVLDSSELKPIIDRVDVLGKYDFLKLTFRPEITSSAKNSFLMLQIRRGEHRSALPSIVIPIRVKYSFLETSLAVSSAVIFVATVIVYWFAGLVLGYASPGQPVSAESIQAFRNVLLPVMILSGGGLLRNTRDFVLGRISL